MEVGVLQVVKKQNQVELSALTASEMSVVSRTKPMI